MTKFHVNPETLEVNKCSAQQKCKFDGQSKHYDSREEAWASVEDELMHDYPLFPDTDNFSDEIDEYYADSVLGMASLKYATDRAKKLGGSVAVIFIEGRVKSGIGYSFPLRAFHISNDNKMYEGNEEMSFGELTLLEALDDIKSDYGEYAQIATQSIASNIQNDDESLFINKFDRMSGIYSDFSKDF